MRIKKGDKVKVITGAYKGTIGEVKAVFPKEDRVIVEGVNMVKKHTHYMVNVLNILRNLKLTMKTTKHVSEIK